jgi:hypothetical protein
MNVSEIYQSMRSLGLASSQVQFSTVWLGRSPRYYSQLVATGRQPSVGALLGLANRLGRIAPSLRPNSGHAMLGLKLALDRHCERRELLAVRRHSSHA